MTASPDALEVLKKAVREQKARTWFGLGMAWECNECGEANHKWKDVPHPKSCWVGQAERLLKQKDEK